MIRPFRTARADERRRSGIGAAATCGESTPRPHCRTARRRNARSGRARVGIVRAFVHRNFVECSRSAVRAADRDVFLAAMGT